MSEFDNPDFGGQWHPSEIRRYCESRRRQSREMADKADVSKAQIVGQGMSPSNAALFRDVVGAGADGLALADVRESERTWLLNQIADEVVVRGEDGRYRATDFAAVVLPHVE